MLRFAWAYSLGWVIQVAAIALGFVIADDVRPRRDLRALWGTAYFLGRKIERERAAVGGHGGVPRVPLGQVGM